MTVTEPDTPPGPPARREDIPTREATPDEWAEAEATIAERHAARDAGAPVLVLTVGQLALPKIVKATSTSQGHYTLGTDFTLTHIVNTADESVIADIVNDATQYVIGSGLISDLPLN